MHTATAAKDQAKSETMSAIGATLAVCVGMLVYVAFTRPAVPNGAEADTAEAAAFGLAIAFPGLVGFVVRRRCPKLLIGAGIACLPAMPLSWGGAGFILFLPALLLGASAGVDCDAGHHRLVHLGGAVGVVVFELAALSTGVPRGNPWPKVPYGPTKTVVIVGIGLALALFLTRRSNRARSVL